MERGKTAVWVLAIWRQAALFEWVGTGQGRKVGGEEGKRDREMGGAGQRLWIWSTGEGKGYAAGREGPKSEQERGRG